MFINSYLPSFLVLDVNCYVLKLQTGDLLISLLLVVKTELGHQNSSHFQNL